MAVVWCISMGLWVEGRTINRRLVDGLDDTGLRLHVEVHLAAVVWVLSTIWQERPSTTPGAAHDRSIERIFVPMSPNRTGCRDG